MEKFSNWQIFLDRNTPIIDTAALF
jgi:hypothetical protein